MEKECKEITTFAHAVNATLLHIYYADFIRALEEYRSTLEIGARFDRIRGAYRQVELAQRKMDFAIYLGRRGQSWRERQRWMSDIAFVRPMYFFMQRKIFELQEEYRTFLKRNQEDVFPLCIAESRPAYRFRDFVVDYHNDPDLTVSLQLWKKVDGY